VRKAHLEINFIRLDNKVYLIHWAW